MGCDGGTIPRRDELVRVKKKPEAKDKDSELAFQWRHCYLTQLPLQMPIVMCGMGHLYNKLSLIEALLDRETLPENVRYIKSLKDVKNLNLTPNPEHIPGDDKKEGSVDFRAAPYICPVIGLEMSGKFRFVALWNCGCVFSERALKEISTANCHKCLKPFEENDVVVLNGTEDDMELMKQRMELRKQKSKKNKEKKESKKEAELANNGAKLAKNEAELAKTGAELTKNGAELANNGAKLAKNGAELTKNGAELAKNGAELTKNGAELAKNGEKVINKSNKGKGNKNKNNRELKRPRDFINDESTKKMKAEYSVAQDPNATDVYKSLFTTHKSENEQQRAHWITYNPFYN